MTTPATVYIQQMGLLTPAGAGIEIAYDAWKENRSSVDPLNLSASLPLALRRDVECIANEKNYRQDDISVLSIVHLLRSYLKNPIHKNCAVIAASSRGAQNLQEKSLFDYFTENKILTRYSPTTTSGRLATVVADELGLSGPAFALSSTCTSSLQALNVARALLLCGSCEEVLVVTSEFANTQYLKQSLLNLGVYASQATATDYPYKPFAIHQDHNSVSWLQNGMVLGEGAAFVLLSKNKSALKLSGVHATTEKSTATGVSENARGLQEAVLKALQQAYIDPAQIDLLMAHGSGNKQADRAEYEAYRAIFPKSITISSTKYLWGHMLGASPLISLILSSYHLAKSDMHSKLFNLPYENIFSDFRPNNNCHNALTTALGFGGSCAAAVVQYQN